MQRMLQKADDTRSELAAEGDVPVRGRWLLLIYHLPTDPSSARSAIWREVKRLGALSLQHGVFLLPDTAGARDAYTGLVGRVEEYGGDASVLKTASPDDAWHAKTAARFNAARDEEYAEVIEESERFQAEVARERRQSKFTFAELEDEESNLERLRKYLAQVEARDAFDAPSRESARAAVAGCAALLAAFAQEIYERQQGAEAAVDDHPERGRAGGADAFR